MILPTHYFIHFLKSGQRLSLEVIREEGKMPTIKSDDNININDLFIEDQKDYFVWQYYVQDLLIGVILNAEEIRLLTEYGKKKLGWVK